MFHITNYILLSWFTIITKFEREGKKMQASREEQATAVINKSNMRLLVCFYIKVEMYYW